MIVHNNLLGQLHREDGPVIDDSSGKIWYINGELHRKDGPAIERSNGHKEWYINGSLHREDGPAVEYPNSIKEWWLNDICFKQFNTKDMFSKMILYRKYYKTFE